MRGRVGTWHEWSGAVPALPTLCSSSQTRQRLGGLISIASFLLGLA